MEMTVLETADFSFSQSLTFTQNVSGVNLGYIDSFMLSVNPIKVWKTKMY